MLCPAPFLLALGLEPIQLEDTINRYPVLHINDPSLIIMKISKKIQQAEKENRIWWSFEYFPPRTAQVSPKLREPLFYRPLIHL